jgi:7-cyano-7-deazaguanosine (preQ0) biosynthesis protein QueE
MTATPPALRPGPDRLIVSEIFGPTFQGEGGSLGRRAGFLRLGHCNLTCHWCDTAYTWDWDRYEARAELTRMTLPQVADAVRCLGVSLLVVTGGEPLIQQRALSDLFPLLAGVEIEVETNGTVVPAPGIVDQVARFNVSPKLANAHVRYGKRIRSPALHALSGTGKAVYKFVVRDTGDLQEIDRLVDEFGLAPVYVMPEGTDPAEVTERMRELAGPVLAHGWNLTTRLHVLLWGNRRGV